MPLVYGKTRHSAMSDIWKELDLTLGEGFKLAEALYSLWRERFPAINNSMMLVNEVCKLLQQAY